MTNKCLAHLQGLTPFLTCLRKGIGIHIASQDWLIIPKAVPAEEGMRILAFDIYKTHDSIQGSVISIEDADNVAHYINNIGRYFLHFGKLLTPA